MTESVIPIATHESHKMGVTINTKDGKLYDHCTVCFECACHSPSVLLTPCDDISWLIGTEN